MCPVEGTFIEYDIFVEIITGAVCLSAEFDISYRNMKWIRRESLNAHQVDGDAGWYEMILNLYSVSIAILSICVHQKSIAHSFCVKGNRADGEHYNAGFRYCYGCLVAILILICRPFDIEFHCSRVEFPTA